MAKTKSTSTLIYEAEPVDSPLRMYCYGCGAGPGQKCHNGNGQQREGVHGVRLADFNNLVMIERKMANLKQQYGAQR